MNGHSHDDGSVLVLYKVVNSKTDSGNNMYNAFHMPKYGGGVTLKGIKRHCAALHHINSAGPDGYHWRVCIEDNRSAGGSSSKSSSIPFSWWDVQDENARLPVNQKSISEIQHMFHGSDNSADGGSTAESSSSYSSSKAAKGMSKMLGKAVDAVAGTSSIDTSGPMVSVIAFKLLDLIQLHDEFEQKHGGGGGGGRSIPAKVQQHRPAAPAPTRQQQPQRQQHPQPTRAQIPAKTPAQQQQQATRGNLTKTMPARTAPPRGVAPAAGATGDMLGFDSPTPPNRKTLNHASSLPSGLFGSTSAPAPPANETRAQKLKREYEAKKQKEQKVWDDVEQRWVTIDPKTANSHAATANGGLGAGSMTNNGQQKKEKGISLSTASAAGKSANVQQAVHKRVADMEENKKKAVEEIRQREASKKQEEAEEDMVRKKLEPKIKVWSEEHGKKKQLRALLGSLHTILWAEANWKPVSIGDILDDKKMVRCFHKASRVVHPDKCHQLDAEKRFLAKRIFDALSQAKAEYDNSK